MMFKDQYKLVDPYDSVESLPRDNDEILTKMFSNDPRLQNYKIHSSDWACVKYFVLLQLHLSTLAGFRVLLVISLLINVIAVGLDLYFFSADVFGYSANSILLSIALIASFFNCCNIANLLWVPSAISTSIALGTTISLIILYSAQIILFYSQNPHHIVIWEIAISSIVLLLVIMTTIILNRYREFAIYNYDSGYDEEDSNITGSRRNSTRQSSNIIRSSLLEESRLAEF